MMPLSGLVRRRFRALHPPSLDGGAPLPSADIESTRQIVPGQHFRRCRCGGVLYALCGRVLAAGVAFALAVGVLLGALLAR